MAYNIGPILTVKGESEFNKAMTAVKSTMSYVKAETAAATSVYSKNEKSVGALTTANEQLKKALTVQSQAVKAAEEALEKMRKGGVDETSDAYKRMEANLNNAKATLNTTEREIKENEQALKELGNETRNTDEKQRQFAETMKTVGAVAGKTVVVAAQAAAVAIAAVATAAVAAAKAVWDMGKESGKWADDILTMSKTMGVAVETLQEIQYAARFVDVEAETISKAFVRVTKAVGAAIKDERDYIELAGGLQVAIRDTSGALMSGEEIFYRVVDALGQIQNATEREVAAQEIFSKSYQDLLPLINAGSQAMKDYAKEARDAGLILSEEMVGKLGEFDDAIQRNEARMDVLKRMISVTFLPALEGAAAGISDLLSTITASISDGIQPGDVKVIGEKLAEMLVGGIRSISKYIPDAIAIIQTAIGDIITITVGLLPEVLPALADGAMALLSGLIATVVENAGQIGQLASDLMITFVTFLAENLPMIVDAGMQVLTALLNGLSTALPMLIPVAVDAMLTIVDTILANLDTLIPAALKVIVALVDGLVKALPKLVEYVPTLVTTIVDVIVRNLPELIKAGLDIIVALIDGLIQALPGLVLWIPNITWGIINSIKGSYQEFRHAGQDVISGLWDGIQERFDKVLESAKSLGNELVNTFKNIWGISSPSKVFAEMGGFMAEGLGKGFTDEMKGVSAQITGSMSVTPTKQTAGGVVINVTMHGGDASAGKSIGNEIVRQMRYKGVLAHA